MNSNILVKECMKQFNKIGIYNLNFYGEKININAKLNYEKLIRTTNIFLGVKIQNKKYTFNIDLISDYDCNDKNIITLFYEVYKNYNKYGVIINDHILASIFQIRSVICTIIKDVIGAMSNILFEYNIKSKVHAYSYLENNFKYKLDSYSNYILCLACRNILELNSSKK